MSVHVNDIFMEGSTEKLEKIKEMINTKFEIQKSGKLKKFIVVNYKWCHYDKVPYKKMTMDKDIKILVDGYRKFTGSDFKVQKTPGDPGTTICNRKIKDPADIDKYRSFMD